MFWLRLALVCLAPWLLYAKPIERETFEIGPQELFENVIKNERKVHPEKCLQKPFYGNCHGSRSMWYFDPIVDKCKRFKYSNCGGNDNRFYIYSECMEFCSNYNLRSVTLED